MHITKTNIYNIINIFNTFCSLLFSMERLYYKLLLNNKEKCNDIKF